MRVGIIQSNYIPWRGYFDLIASVDVFIFHDDAQYTKQDWRNRNRLRLRDGLHWITVPVKAHPVDTAIDQIEIDGREWQAKHERMMEQALRSAPYYMHAKALWEVAKDGHRTLSDLNQELIRRVCMYLGISTRFLNARDLCVRGSKTDKVLGIVKAVGGTTYLSGPAAAVYLDVERMNRHGIEVEWMRYRNDPYPQQFAGFEPAVSILDTIANVGAMRQERMAA